jgi:BASS family bile acid:Na+ symporter
VPAHFVWFKDFISPGLGIIMLGMGLTLSFNDFRNVLARPGPVAVGVGAQFIIMPALGFTLAKLFRLEPELATGLILVSCCPGGTASNVIAYLARANVALSVLMTMCSTFVAILATPFLTKMLAGAYMPIDAFALFQSTVTVVLVPVVAGLLLNRFFPKTVGRLQSVAPLVSVLVIVLIVGCIVALSKEQILANAGTLLTVVGLLHVSAFSLGYLFARIFRYPEDYCRTLSIEVGMQNSGLGAALAKAHLGGLTPVPSAISAVYHCLIGSLLAGLWRLRPSSGDPPSRP